MATESAFGAVLRPEGNDGYAGILLVRRQPEGKLYLPGRRLRKGERPKKAIEDELFKLLGLRAQVYWPIGRPYQLRDGNGTLRDTAYLFHVVVAQPQRINSTDIVWGTIPELEKLHPEIASPSNPRYPRGRIITMIQEALQSHIIH